MLATRLLVLAFVAMGATAQVSDMASANYRIRWDVADGGGNMMTSANYVLVDSVGQPTPVGASSSANHRIQAGFHAIPDTDADLVRDFLDNCLLDPNAAQRDTDNDGFGNICDADLDDSGLINFADLLIMREAFLSSPDDPNWNPDADLNGDDTVDDADLFLMKIGFFGPPGPSGIAP